jgi:hypothetical protein
VYTGAKTGADQSTERQYSLADGETVGSAFHSYGEIWSWGMIQYYVDDPTKPFFVVTASDPAAKASWPFDDVNGAGQGPNRFYLLLNMAVGGTCGGSPDSGTAGNAMLVDHVRVYQASPITAPSIAPASPISVGRDSQGQMSGSTTVALSSASGTGRVYLTCTTTVPDATCSVTTADPDNQHTLDFTNTTRATATVDIAASDIAVGNYTATLSAYTASNVTGRPDATRNIPVTVK